MAFRCTPSQFWRVQLGKKTFALRAKQGPPGGCAFYGIARAPRETRGTGRVDVQNLSDGDDAGGLGVGIRNKRSADAQSKSLLLDANRNQTPLALRERQPHPWHSKSGAPRSMRAVARARGPTR